MIDLLGLHRPDDGEFVDDFGGVRQKLAEPGAAFAVLRELEDGGRGGNFVWKALMPVRRWPIADGFRQIGAALFSERGLVVEQIELGRRAVLEEIDDSFGGGREIRDSQG